MTAPPQETLRDALDTDRISDLVRDLAELPTDGTYTNHVEDDLWRTITEGRATNDTQIRYADLPSNSKSLFGYTETDEDQILPWWFNQFNWTVAERGDDLTINSIEDLESLANYDPNTLTIEKPKYNKTAGLGTFADVLGAFDDVCTELENRLNLDSGQTNRDPPEEVFEIANNTLRTTSTFQDWFDRLLTYCPPMNTPLTALFLVNTNVECESIHDLIPEETYTLLKDLVVTDGVIYNKSLQTGVETILSLEAPFDLALPVDTDTNALQPLEAQFYQTWAAKTIATPELRRWLQQAAADNPDSLQAGEQKQFGSAALTAPLQLERNHPVFTTLDLYAESTNSEGYKTEAKLSEVQAILSRNGNLDDA